MRVCRLWEDRAVDRFSFARYCYFHFFFMVASLCYCVLWSCVRVNGTPAFNIVSLYLRNPIMLYIMCMSASFRAFVSAAAL